MSSKYKKQNKLHKQQKNNKPAFDNKINSGWTNWDMMLSPFHGRLNLRIMEIGCFKGEATSWFLTHLLNGPNAAMYAIDTFEGSPEYEKSTKFKSIEEAFHANTLATGKSKYLTVMKMMSQQALIKLVSKQANYATFDIIYVDASHEAIDVLSDGVLAWNLLAPGGYMIFDDYEWDKLNRDYFTPKPAIDAFMHIYASQLKVLHKKRQVFVQKLQSSEFEVPLVSLLTLESNMRQKYGHQQMIRTFKLSSSTATTDQITIRELPAFDMDISVNPYYYLIEKPNKRFNRSFDEFLTHVAQKHQNRLSTRRIFNRFSTYDSFTLVRNLKSKNINIFATTWVSEDIPNIATFNAIKQLSKNKAQNLTWVIPNHIFGEEFTNRKIIIDKPHEKLFSSRINNTKDIAFIKSNAGNLKYDVMRLHVICQRQQFLENNTGNCSNSPLLNLIIAFNLQEVGGTLLIPSIPIQQETEYFMQILTIGSKYYEDIKLCYSPLEYDRYTIVFQGFKGINTTQLKYFNDILDKLKLENNETSTKNFNKPSAEIQKIKVDPNIYGILATFNTFANKNVFDYMEHLRLLTNLNKLYKDDDKRKFHELITNLQLYVYNYWYSNNITDE